MFVNKRSQGRIRRIYSAPYFDTILSASTGERRRQHPLYIKVQLHFNLGRETISRVCRYSVISLSFPL